MVKEKNLLSTLTPDQRIEILRRNWMSHDARWQYATFQELGVEKGNELNHTVSKQMGRTVMYRLMNALEIARVRSIEELKAICEVTMDLYYPPPRFVYHFDLVSENTLFAVMEHCTIYENVKRAGMADLYECACVAMHAGWFEALDIEVEEKLTKSLKNGDERCEFLFKIKT